MTVVLLSENMCLFSRAATDESLVDRRVLVCRAVVPGVCPVERTGRAGVWNALETPRFPRAWSSCLSANGEYARGVLVVVCTRVRGFGV